MSKHKFNKEGTTLVYFLDFPMATPVKVYGPTLSTAVSRVLACLLEKDVQFQLLPVNMAKGEHKTPDYLKIQASFFFLRLVDYLNYYSDSCFLFTICSTLTFLIFHQPFGQVPAYQDEDITLFGNYHFLSFIFLIF